MIKIRSLLAVMLLCVFSLGSYAGPVNINTAEAGALAENIVGVGPKLAQRIVDFRQANGEFSSIEELTQVKGIGEKLVDKNRDNLMLEEPAKP